MRRRRLLGTSAALFAGSVAGCIGDERSPTGPRTPPDAPREESLEEDVDPAGEDRETDEEGDTPDDPDEEDDPEPTDPPGDLRVDSVDFEADEEEMLLVTVVVENVADNERDGRLIVRVFAGEEEFVVTREITVAAGDVESYELRPGVEYERFAADGVIDATVHTAE
ncbi:hypothetical protein AArcSl_0354 [Halalkaliarchaeum desulfuricum]|uniref:Uncharacterized protein n=1 Tax=Halalkaliarchaeum desulfuricum TaxID=2055893 RepID=A0A343TFY5_9EURY|nr:hypothetical protein [Halalkaliarchaeum desulfuricum]AUX08007.1 hypothetical protein AArcSl_0354 [Halalkaliarchaeum desulfuricum]